MIKHFLKKNWKKIIIVLLILTMWGAGFFCAWKVQDIKIDRCKILIVRVGVLLGDWEKKIEKLEREKKEREKEKERIKEWNDLIED